MHSLIGGIGSGGDVWSGGGGNGDGSVVVWWFGGLVVAMVLVALIDLNFELLLDAEWS